ncbi:MAG: DUF5777 family beta-barrel protein [Candidatus Aminicenantales bacterium]
MRSMKRLVIFMLSFAAAAFLLALGAQTNPTLRESAVPILAKNCATAGCHAGSSPMMNLSFEAARLPDQLIGKISLGASGRVIIDPAEPEKSYLLAKLRGDPDISGGRMPLRRPALSPEEQKAVTDWVLSLRGYEKNKIQNPAAEKTSRTGNPPFWGLSLVNLPTSELPPPGRFSFRVSHRFYPSLREGVDALFGLDGPAAVWLGLGYGLTERIGLTLGRTNQGKEVETAVRWRFLDQDVFPFEAALQAGVGWAAEKIDSRKRTDARHFKLNVQMILAKRLTDRVSVLVVPSLSTHTDHWEENPQNTFAVGLGGRWLVLNGLSLIAEWTPVFAGYAAASNGWGFGLEKKIGGHVFQVFVTNGTGLTPDLYLPGGDLRLSDGDLRLGFNIFRTF